MNFSTVPLEGRVGGVNPPWMEFRSIDFCSNDLISAMNRPCP